ncbi:MAG: class I SAM-dependent methyltransferase [Neisseria sp.]|nr:class I SAM-dependent methyltransferase [Neisseria sp.]
MAVFKDYFSSSSDSYAAYRPDYPAELAQWLADCAPSRRTALDCACGTGQLGVLLAEYFQTVYAADASAAQIANAAARPNVAYRVAPAERSGLADGSVDLITVAQAAHWLDLPAFYAEARRVARPNALLALISYGVLHVDNAVIDGIIGRFYRQTIAPYWPPERRHVENGYADLPFPFARVDAPPFAMCKRWNLAQLSGYLSTWSAVAAARKVLPADPWARLEAELAAVWGGAETEYAVSWPLTVRAGRIKV